MIKDWLGLVDFDPNSWNNFEEVEGWWTTIVLSMEVGGSPSPPSSCLPLGNFGKRGMLKPSTTRALCPLVSSKMEAHRKWAVLCKNSIPAVLHWTH
jgi:hypothetical protein